MIAQPLTGTDITHFILDDFNYGGYWDLLAVCERTFDYDGKEGPPALLEIWSRGQEVGRLPYNALPRGFVEAVQESVDFAWRWGSEDDD